jgi:predicted MPP superfamily phosphohydrolase
LEDKKFMRKKGLREGTLSLAVLSDLHAFDKTIYSSEKDYPSFLDMSISEGSDSIQPIKALKLLIKNENLKTDVLVCTGDMGDKAHPAAIQYAWNKILEIKKCLNCKLVVAVPGNHDHDSRSKYCGYDPRGHLQNLSHQFPILKESYRLKFWASNYAIVKESFYRIVLLNSSAFHGIREEFKHGRISPITLDNLKKDLKRSSEIPLINILACHHHPLKYEEANFEDYDVMTGGQALIDILGSGEFGDWIIIHGHRHYPKLSYASGTGASPIIFSAGSLCAFLEPPIFTRVKNQFYIINFNVNDIKRFGFVGSFRAWDWNYAIGYSPAQSNSGLPFEGGFGYRAQINKVASKIAEKIGGSPKIGWDTLTKSLPYLKYVIPADLNVINNLLEKKHKAKIVRSEDGKIIEIGKKA